MNSNTLLHSTSRASIISVKLVKFTWECAVAKRSKFEKAEIKLGSKNGLGLTMWLAIDAHPTHWRLSARKLQSTIRVYCLSSNQRDALSTQNLATTNSKRLVWIFFAEGCRYRR